MNVLLETIRALKAPAALTAAGPNGSRSLTIARVRHDGGEVEFGGGESLCLVFSLSEHRVERRVGGSRSHCRAGIGRVTLADPEETTTFTISGRADSLLLILPLAELAEAAGPDRSRSVKARFMETDPELQRCAHRALVMLHDGDGSDALLLSSLVLRLSSRLIEPMKATSRAKGGLSARQVRDVQELIAVRTDKALADSPTLSELAAEANLSLHHFAREFRRTVGVTPYAYMLRQRLERAQALLVKSNLALSEVG